MSAESTAAPGQESAAAATPGQAPPAAVTATLSHEDALAALAAARRESAGYRTRLSAFEKTAADQEAAGLSESEKLSKRNTQLEADLTAERRDRKLGVDRYEVQLAAGKLGIVDPDAAVKLLDWSTVEYGTDGSPTNVEAALKALIAKRPYLASQQQQPSIGATNPGTRAAPPGARTYSRSELGDYEFYSKNREDIQSAMKEGRVTD